MDDPGIHAAVDVLLAADTTDVSRDELDEGVDGERLEWHAGVAVPRCDRGEVGVEGGDEEFAAFGVELGVEVVHAGAPVDPASHAGVAVLPVGFAGLVDEQAGEVAAGAFERRHGFVDGGGKQRCLFGDEPRAGGVVETRDEAGDGIDMTG